MIYEDQTKSKSFAMIDNYIYLYHVQKFIVLPTYPQTIADSMSATFSQTTTLSRSAPIYSYSNSGPRSLQINLEFHRDMMNEVNYTKSNLNVEIGDDYVDTIIKQLQAITLPRYNAASKMVDPPMIAIRFGDDIFCKGVISTGLTIDYKTPILQDVHGKNKYGLIDMSFAVNEVDPYDADLVMSMGSFRTLNTSLERNLWKSAANNSFSSSPIKIT